ncbi:MAG: chromate efflux transporter [Euryarchaeota archaeon]|nr:chromate efflux transporter [Euryarchaeota archaeon]
MEPGMEGTAGSITRSPAAIFLRFLLLGFQSWGDSSSRLAVLYRELVEKEGWMSNLAFARAYAVYHALPGPEAIEMAVHLGYRRSGRLGGLLAGIGFSLPGLLFALALAALYLRFGRDAWGLQGALYAIKPVVIALIAQAIIKIGRVSLHNDVLIHLALASFLASLLLPINIVVIIFVLAAGYFVAQRNPGSSGLPALALTPLLLKGLGLPVLVLLPLFFFEAGMLTFGGSYTVLPFIQRGIDDFGWFSHETFLDAVALCTLVPGPMVLVGAFLGYLLEGLPGGLLAAAAVLAPAFAFTLIAPKPIIRLAESPRVRDFFDGVTAAVVGLVAVTLLRLVEGAIVDVATLALAVVSFLALTVRRVNAFVVVAVSAALGVLFEAADLLP